MAGRIIPLIVSFALGAFATAPAAEPLGLVPSDAFLRSQVKEPVFAWAFALVEADSLGSWDAADLQAFSDGWTNPSDFPLEHLASFRRQALPDSAQVEREGLVCTRQVVIEFTTPRLDMPMPYSILGYHPGTLSFGGPIVVREWRVGARDVAVRGEDGTRRTTVHGLVVFEIISDWLILDVDDWLDKLLGNKLDDAANMGFAAARGDGRLLGLANSLGRDGHFVFGEMDFREGTVAPHGRPLARALIGLVRRWSDPAPDQRTAVWALYDAASP